MKRNCILFNHHGGLSSWTPPNRKRYLDSELRDKPITAPSPFQTGTRYLIQLVSAPKAMLSPDRHQISGVTKSAYDSGLTSVGQLGSGVTRHGEELTSQQKV